jgi:hypothetical protein
MPRAWLVSLFALAVALLGGRVARADEVADVRPRAAAHAAFVAGDTVTWTTTYNDCVSSDASAPAQRVLLSTPLRATLDADRSQGVTPALDAQGRIVALVFDGRGLRWPLEVHATLRATVERSGDEIVLHPPLARSLVAERVEVAGEGDVRFEPSPSMGLVHNVGSWSTPGLSERTRHTADDVVGGHDAPLDEPPLYIGPSSELAQGLRGRTLTGAERARPGMLVALTVFLFLVIAITASYRWLGGRARIEQAEAVLREEYERTAR